MVIKAVLAIAAVFATSTAPSIADVNLGDGVVVITAPDGAIITGTVCNHTTEVCIQIPEQKGTVRTELPIKHGDLIGFSGQFNQASVDIVKPYSNRGEFEWLEKTALVLAGAIAGMIGNLLIVWYSDQRKDHVEQRAKFRTWRDSMHQKIKQRETDNGIKFRVDVPEGLSKKTGKKINELEAQLDVIEKKLHAQPAQAQTLLTAARQLLIGSSS